MANRASLATLFLHGLLYGKPASLTPLRYRLMHRFAQIVLAIALALTASIFFEKDERYPRGLNVFGVNVFNDDGYVVFHNDTVYRGGVNVLQTAFDTFLFSYFTFRRTGEPTLWALWIRKIPMALAAIICPLIWTAILLRRWHQTMPFECHCPSCGYDLRATPTRCPECGMKVEPTATRTTPPEA